jgi:uncharacterized protein (DUF2267 family)
MEHSDFIKRVQEAGDLESPEQAQSIIEATLGTLGELLSKTERGDLAAELHKPLTGYLDAWLDRPTQGIGRPHRFGIEEFYNRVSARSDAGYPTAVKGSQAVVSVLLQAVSAGQLRDVFRELPDDYAELLSGRPRGAVSPPRGQ